MSQIAASTAELKRFCQRGGWLEMEAKTKSLLIYGDCDKPKTLGQHTRNELAFFCSFAIPMHRSYNNLEKNVSEETLHRSQELPWGKQ